MMRSLGFKAQQTNPKKKTRFKERAWSSPFPHSFGCKRETQRERERERERENRWWVGQAVTRMKRDERTRSSTLSLSSSPSSQNCSYPDHAFWWQLFCEEFFVDAASILFIGKGLLDDEDYFAKESDHKILVFRSVCKKELIDSGMLGFLFASEEQELTKSQQIGCCRSCPALVKGKKLLGGL
jgi:hypothetical protein